MRTADPHQHRPAPGHRPGHALLALTPPARRPSRPAAFTLVEMLAAAAVAAILLGAAVPGFRAMLERHAVRAAAADLLAALHLARSLAIGRGENVVVAPADPAGMAWRDGWTVFADTDGDARPGPGETVLFQHGPAPDGLRIWSRLTHAAPPWYVAYNSAGRSCRAGNSLAANWGTLSLQLGRTQRNIKINMLGRARLCDPGAETGCGMAGE
ncbi:GspH/FimT family protein [Pseudoduganella albidiflava]|uniref:Type II secretion system protein H n=2 Tax=Pseudoduganella albidiflava TaxID=321983 RepID=A0ABX5RW98_9BURK|nr:GspH/FimT family protein [Pseudoduganella albidiflava]QBI02887.1 prepilin-type N-terminal cleavage/methylation domain-containing protein [Pseudoduganella albidiflava]